MVAIIEKHEIRRKREAGTERLQQFCPDVEAIWGGGKHERAAVKLFGSRHFTSEVERHL